MTTPAERTRAVLDARQFLLELSAMDVPGVVRRRAERLLRHYPHGGHIDVASAAMPMVWGPGTEGVPTDVPTYPELLAQHHTVRLEPPRGNKLIGALLGNEDRSRTILASLAVGGTLLALAAVGYANIFLR